MLESVSIVGALATASMIVRQVLILAIALRGAKPSERPAIIRALADFTHAVGTRRNTRRRSLGG